MLICLFQTFLLLLNLENVNAILCPNLSAMALSGVSVLCRGS